VVHDVEINLVKAAATVEVARGKRQRVATAAAAVNP